MVTLSRSVSWPELTYWYTLSWKRTIYGIERSMDRPFAARNWRKVYILFTILLECEAGLRLQHILLAVFFIAKWMNITVRAKQSSSASICLWPDPFQSCSALISDHVCFTFTDDLRIHSSSNFLPLTFVGKIVIDHIHIMPVHSNGCSPPCLSGLF